MRAQRLTHTVSPLPRRVSPLAFALILALVLAFSACAPAGQSSASQPTSATSPTPVANVIAPTPTAGPPTTPCPPGTPNIANIVPGGEGAPLDTFATRWGPASGVAMGSTSFGRYSDTHRQKVLVPSYLPPNNRVWSVQYFVDTTQQVSLADVSAIAASILPKDAAQQGQPQQTGDGVATYYCSPAMLAAFPPGTSVNQQPMPDSGMLHVSYVLRADGFVDSIGVAYGA